jgi:type VI secretion system protein
MQGMQSLLVPSGAATGAARREPPPDAVVTHLTRLLNTREGSCLLDPSFGLPDLTDFTHGSPAEAALLSRILCERITRHEPRLCRLTVRASEAAVRPPRLRYALRARLADGTRLALTVSIAGGGQVSLQPEVNLA